MYIRSILCPSAWWYSFFPLSLVVWVSQCNWLASAPTSLVWMSYPANSHSRPCFVSHSHGDVVYVSSQKSIHYPNALEDCLSVQRENTRSRRQHLNHADFLHPRQVSVPLYVLYFSSVMATPSHTLDSPSDTSMPMQGKVSETNLLDPFLSELSFAFTTISQCWDNCTAASMGSTEGDVSYFPSLSGGSCCCLSFVAGSPSISIHLSSNVISSYFLLPSEWMSLDSAHEIFSSGSLGFGFVTLNTR